MSSSRPSVLAVVSDFPAPSQTFILRKLRGLAGVGYDISVVADAFGRGASDEGFRLVPLVPWRQPASLPRTVGWGGVAGTGRHLVSTVAGPGHRSVGAKRRALLAPLTATGPDIVHFEFSGIAVAVRDLLDELGPARLVVSCRGAAEQIVPLHDPRRAPALEEVFARMDLIHCVSEDIAATARSLGAPDDRILVNRPAVPVADFAPLAERRVAHDGPLRVLSVGRLHWKKGLDDGMRAVAAAIGAGHEVDYRIAGEGAEREKLSFLRHQLGLGDHATLLGTCTQAEVADLLVWADVLVLPSLSEGISNAALEAMAAGLPVIATESGGMREVIEDGVDGFVVDIGDVAAIAAHLGRLATDAELRRRTGEAAARRAAAEFDISRQIRVFDEAYRRLLATPG